MLYIYQLVGLLAATSILLLAACGGSGDRDERLTIFAASSLTDVFREAVREFEEVSDGIRVTLNLAATSALRLQLEQGAGADLFASADERNMELAEQAGLVDGKPVVFATNRLAIVVAVDGEVNGIKDLAKPGIYIVVGAPQTPIGTYTRAAIERMERDPALGPEFAVRLRENVVSEALNVRAAVATVQLGEADAAIGYVTDAVGPNQENLRAILFDKAHADVAIYPIALVASADAPDAAREFIAFLRSDAGLRILRSFGFGGP
jgi:molybdate transport system substrate-binding protein